MENISKQTKILVSILGLVMIVGSFYFSSGNLNRPSNIIKATFLCSEGKSIETAFHTGEERLVDLKLNDGRSLTLPQTISASGARYANADESFVFWNKGDTAFITEEGTTTYSDCVVK